MADPAPVARLVAFGDNGIELELRLWIVDPEMGMVNVRSDVNLAMWKAFKEAGITIPFPQRDVYVKEFRASDEQTVAASSATEQAPADTSAPAS